MNARLGEVVEFEFMNRKGQNLVVEGKISVIDKEADFKTLALLDITEKRKIATDLLRTKERFRLLVETNPFGLFLVVDGRVRYANQAGLEILGMEEEEVFNQEVIQFFTPSDRSPIEEDIAPHSQWRKTHVPRGASEPREQRGKGSGFANGFVFFR